MTLLEFFSIIKTKERRKGKKTVTKIKKLEKARMDTKTMEKAGKKGKGVKYRKRFKKKR